MELQEVVNEESRLKSTHSLVRLLCGLLAHRASDKVIVFLEFHGQSAKTAITVRVERLLKPSKLLEVVIQPNVEIGTDGTVMVAAYASSKVYLY